MWQASPRFIPNPTPFTLQGVWAAPSGAVFVAPSTFVLSRYQAGAWMNWSPPM